MLLQAFDVQNKTGLPVIVDLEIGDVDAQTAPTHLYYYVVSKDKPLYHPELEAIVAAVNNFEVMLIVSGVDQRLSVTRIKQDSNFLLIFS